MFGREARLPTDILEGKLEDIKWDVKQYQTDLTWHLKDANDIVRNQIENNAKKMKLQFESKIMNHHIFKTGDRVLMFHPRINAKSDQQPHQQVWSQRWEGPLTILQRAHKDNKDVYIIRDEDTLREWTVNVNKLRPYYVLGDTSDESSC